MERIKSMNRRLFHARGAFYAYEAMREQIAPNVVGEIDASENAKLIGRFGNFFQPAQEALRVYFFIELAKLFDSSKKSLHINRVVNLTERNLKNLTVHAFRAYNHSQNRVFLEELAEEYRGMSYAELESIKKELKKHGRTIKKLKTYRDGWLAHNDEKENAPPTITGEEIRELFQLIEKILNTISAQLNSESWSYSHIEQQAKWHTKIVFEYLRRYEPYRLKEIEEETDKKIREYTSRLKNNESLDN